MSRVPPPVPIPPPPPSPRVSLNRAQGDISEAELAALLPPESDGDEAQPKPPPPPGKTSALKASAIPPPLPTGTAKGATTVVPPPLPGSAGTVSVVPPPVWGTEALDPDDNISKPKQPQKLTAQQKTLLYLLSGSFLGAIVLITLLIFVSRPTRVPEPVESTAQIETSDTVLPTGQTRPNTFDLETEPDPEFIDPYQ